MNTQNKPEAKAFARRVIHALGGTAEVARLCKVQMAAVSQWKENGIPGYRVMFLRLARPDVFEGDEQLDSVAVDQSAPPSASRTAA